MTWEDLPADRAAVCQSQVARMLRYHVHLRRRLDRLGLLPSDPLYAAVVRSMASLQDLHVQLHYCACTHGVGRVDRR